jgi:Transposase
LSRSTLQGSADPRSRRYAAVAAVLPSTDMEDRDRTHSIEFKRQVVLGGESPHALARRHGISRNLIKIWVAKYEAGGLDSDTAAADVLADYEARIGRQAYIGADCVHGT